MYLVDTGNRLAYTRRVLGQGAAFGSGEPCPGALGAGHFLSITLLERKSREPPRDFSYVLRHDSTLGDRFASHQVSELRN